MTDVSIAKAVRDVADYVQNGIGSAAFDIFPGRHPRTQPERETEIQASLNTVADRLRAFATRSETEPVRLADFVGLLHGLPVPDKICKPAEWAIYDRYGA